LDAGMTTMVRVVDVVVDVDVVVIEVDVVDIVRTIWVHHVDSTRSSQVVRAVRDEAEAEVEVGLDVVDTVIEVSVVGMVSEVSVEDTVSAVSAEVIEVVVVVDEVALATVEDAVVVVAVDEVALVTVEDEEVLVEAVGEAPTEVGSVTSKARRRASPRYLHRHG